MILKALDKDPELRYQTAKELLVDLERLQVTASSTSGARLEPTPAEVGRRRRRRARLTAAAAAVILAVAASFWLLSSPRPPRITNARPVTGGMEGLNAGGGWATDGARLYYLAERPSGTTVYQVPVTGGEPAPVPIALPVPYNHLICGYLPRESALLMTGSSRPTARRWPLGSLAIASSSSAVTAP